LSWIRIRNTNTRILFPQTKNKSDIY